MLEEMKKQLAEQKREKAEELRIKNAKLRAEGKDPLKGWNRMVDTGLGGLNKGGMAANGVIDMTGENLGTMNFFSEEQKELAKELEKKRH
ncbi:hypothetical protein [Enterococcus songbeiensis]|uniref:hypothetical protein n=1 Tax=Enterococcus songbeiensis TaxID=2559927 RepID=UPI0010F9C6DC|nr:hypothetical protein [Enterococcus songbeiensis]